MTGTDLSASFALVVMLALIALVVAWILLPIMVMGLRSQVRELARQQAAGNELLRTIASESAKGNKLLQASQQRGDGQAVAGQAAG